MHAPATFAGYLDCLYTQKVCNCMQQWPSRTPTTKFSPTFISGFRRSPTEKNWSRKETTKKQDPAAATLAPCHTFGPHSILENLSIHNTSRSWTQCQKNLDKTRKLQNTTFIILFNKQVLLFDLNLQIVFIVGLQNRVSISVLIQ